MECKGATSPLKSMQPFLEVPEIRPPPNRYLCHTQWMGKPLTPNCNWFCGYIASKMIRAQDRMALPISLDGGIIFHVLNVFVMFSICLK